MGFNRGISANIKLPPGNKSGGNKNLQQSLSKIQGNTEVGRVTDIILNGDYPNIEEYGGLNSIGTIRFELVSSNNQGKGVAKPFYPQISAYPLVNEIILLFLLPNTDLGTNLSAKSYYYINMVSLWNHPHHNAYPNPNGPNNLPDSQQKDYQQTQAGSVRRVTDESTEINLNSPTNPSQATFIERIDIHPLLPFAGDVIYQGRWGNSIRFGSTAKPEASDALNDWSSTGGNGDPLTIIRNGQPPESSDEGWVPITENVNEDLSSIYLTSTQKLPLSTQNPSFFSYKEAPDTPDVYVGPQVVINSDRLVFNAKKDHILISGEKSVNLSSNNSLNFDTNEFIIDAGDVKLGSKDATEPVIKGDTLYKNLNQIIDSILTLADLIQVQQMWPGGAPTPDPAASIAATTSITILNAVQNDLINIKSKVCKTI